MSHLGNEAFRKMIIGAAAACHGDVGMVRAQLEDLERDAQRWREFRAALSTGQFGKVVDALSGWPSEKPSGREVDESFDRALTR